MPNSFKRLFKKNLGRENSGIPRSELELPAAQYSRFGLTIVAESKQDPAADIVFVHGLNGSYETWTKDEVLWPRDLLPAVLPQARAILFGYDSSVVRFFGPSSSGTNYVQSIAIDLAMKLRVLRQRSDTVGRPLLFVVHSLGGLVVKRALQILRERISDEFQDIATNTVGICFLGTPHQGSIRSNWLRDTERIAKITRPNSNISVLLQKSNAIEYAAEIDEGFFRSLRANPDFQIESFYEELPTMGVGNIVDRASATLPGYPSIGIHASHNDLVKFSSQNDIGFIGISSSLRRMLNTAVDSRERKAKSVTGDLTLNPIPDEGHLRIVDSPTLLSEEETFEHWERGAPEMNLDLEPVPQVSLEQEVRDLIRSQDYDRAETLQRQLVETSQLSLGLLHETTIRRQMALSDIYLIRGKWMMATKAMKDIPVSPAIQLGQKNEIYREFQLRLARSYALNSNFEEANKIVESFLLDVDSPGVFLSFESSLLWHNKQPKQATVIQSKFVSLSERQMGEDNFRALDAQSTLNMMQAGSCAKDENKEYEKGQNIRKRQELVVKNMARILGERHPHVIFLTGALAYIIATDLRSERSDIREAQDMIDMAILRLREILGPDHPNCIALMYNLALVDAAVGRSDAANVLLEMISRTVRTNLEEPHILSIMSKRALHDLELEGETAISYMRKNMLVPTVDIGMYLFTSEIENDLLSDFFSAR